MIIWFLALLGCLGCLGGSAHVKQLLHDRLHAGSRFFRRVEVAFPVKGKKNQARLVEEGLEIYFADERDAWRMHADGAYSRIGDELAATGDGNGSEELSGNGHPGDESATAEPFAAQDALLERMRKPTM